MTKNFKDGIIYISEPSLLSPKDVWEPAISLAGTPAASYLKSLNIDVNSKHTKKRIFNSVRYGSISVDDTYGCPAIINALRNIAGELRAVRIEFIPYNGHNSIGSYVIGDPSGCSTHIGKDVGKTLNLCIAAGFGIYISNAMPDPDHTIWAAMDFGHLMGIQLPQRPLAAEVNILVYPPDINEEKKILLQELATRFEREGRVVRSSIAGVGTKGVVGKTTQTKPSKKGEVQ